MSITWLASYPKSGNTWLRFLLANIIAGGPPSCSADVARLIPDIHRPGDMEGVSGDVFVKTHFMRTDAHPRIDETARAVHIVRHPRDVLLSALNYRRMEGVIEDMTDERYARVFISSAGDPLWARLGYGSWVQHAASWSQATAWPVLTIRYEDLKADTAGTLRRVLDFAGLEATPDAIDRAVAHSSFENLRALEVRERSSKGPTIFPGSKADMRAGRFFFNKGASGQSLDTIGEGLDAALVARFGPAMSRLGYASEG